MIWSNCQQEPCNMANIDVSNNWKLWHCGMVLILMSIYLLVYILTLNLTYLYLSLTGSMCSYCWLQQCVSCDNIVVFGFIMLAVMSVHLPSGTILLILLILYVIKFHRSKAMGTYRDGRYIKTWRWFSLTYTSRYWLVTYGHQAVSTWEWHGGAESIDT